MSPEARALAEALLDHHRRIRCQPDGAPPSVDSALIPYGQLYEKAGLSLSGRDAGPLLRQIAVWCRKNGWPPLNALAVNHRTRRPGAGYDNAPGCSFERWADQVTACVEFCGYPERVE